jgi:hypothetical protein
MRCSPAGLACAATAQGWALAGNSCKPSAFTQLLPLPLPLPLPLLLLLLLLLLPSLALPSLQHTAQQHPLSQLAPPPPSTCATMSLCTSPS